MGMMVVSKALSLHAPAAGEALWFAAVTLHLLFLAGFAWCQLRAFTFSSMVPSWFVPPVGIVTAAPDLAGRCVRAFRGRAAAVRDRRFRAAAAGDGLPAYLPCGDSRRGQADHSHSRGPRQLSLAGYLSVEPRPSLIVTAVLLGVAVLMTVIYIGLIRLLRLPFSPAYAAFTFPLVISATALFKAVGCSPPTPRPRNGTSCTAWPRPNCRRGPYCHTPHRLAGTVNRDIAEHTGI